MTSITRTTCGCLLALLLLVGTAAPAQAQLGIAGGLNFESLGDIRAELGEVADGEANFDNSTGYHIGAVYNLSLGPVDLRPGVIFRRVGEYEFTADEFGGVVGEDESYSVSTIEVPLDIRVNVLPVPVLNPYVLAGPMLSFPSGEGDFDEATEGTAFSLNVGAGLGISVPGLGIELQPELRYEFGATSVFSDETITLGVGDREVNFTPQDDPNFSAFSARLHVLF